MGPPPPPSFFPFFPSFRSLFDLLRSFFLIYLLGKVGCEEEEDKLIWLVGGGKAFLGSGGNQSAL